MADMTVANTILQQLGGAQFRAMTGSRDFIGGSNFLIFRIGSGAKKGINKCRVTLESNDTYTVEFFRLFKKLSFIPVSKHTDIYCDQLQDLFEAETGMYTTLKPRS